MEPNENGSCTWWIRGHDYLPLVSNVFKTLKNNKTRACRDINAYTKSKAELEPTTIFKGHTSVVGVRIYHLSTLYNYKRISGRGLACLSSKSFC